MSDNLWLENNTKVVLKDGRVGKVSVTRRERKLIGCGKLKVVTVKGRNFAENFYVDEMTVFQEPLPVDTTSDQELLELIYNQMLLVGANSSISQEVWDKLSERVKGSE